MSAITEYRLPLTFSSSAEAGAVNISSDGSSFDVVLERPIVVPDDAFNCYLTVRSATVWWNTYNIEEGVNDRMLVLYDNGVGTTHLLTVDPGLYDLEHLQTELERQFVLSNIPEDMFTLVPDLATQKVAIRFHYDDTQIEFDISHTMRELLGFDARKVPLAPSVKDQTEKGDSVARFNVLDHFLIHSDIVSRGILINGEYRNIVAQVFVTEAPGSQIISEPFNPPEIPTDELIGTHRNNVRVYLTDHNSNAVDTHGEIFTVNMVLHYSVFVKNT